MAFRDNNQMKTPNIADLRGADGSRLTPMWFDLSNYDLEPDWTQPDEGAKMRVYRGDEADLDTPLDFA